MIPLLEPLPPEVPSDKSRKLQLDAARYTFHKVTRARYMEQIQRHGNIEQSREMYRLAMANYDGIIKDAVSGASHEANMEDMKKGFDG